MKKFSFRALFIILLVIASISAQIFISSNNGAQSNGLNATHRIDRDSMESPHIQLDIEILKTIVEHGKNHLPVIKSSDF